ncbi:MAG TPA: hypothetical protein VE291_00900 [Terracidiphilus sp.]|nr:hypothetical protein [Terracidiphilus sp.]
MRLIAAALIAALCGTQMPCVLAQDAPGTSTGTITVPQGTNIPLTLVSPIRNRMKSGDAVRAQVAFPVTVGTQVAIPAGTYVQGTLIAVHPQGTAGKPASVELHLTGLLFANGYSVPVDATNTQALVIAPELEPQNLVELADARDGAPYLGEGFGEGQTTPPPLPPLPHEGPNPAVIGGAIAGGAAAFVVLAIVLRHHRRATADYVVFDSGWQFQMVLGQPLILDAGKVAAAAAAPAR